MENHASPNENQDASSIAMLAYIQFLEQKVVTLEEVIEMSKLIDGLEKSENSYPNG